jgi:predicted sugar kinase
MGRPKTVEVAARSVVDDVAAAAESLASSSSSSAAAAASSSPTLAALVPQQQRGATSAAGAVAAAVGGGRRAGAQRADSMESATPSSKRPRHARVRTRNQLPETVRFALVVVLSFTLSSLSHSFLHELTRGEAASIARGAESNAEVVVWAAWRV